MRLVLGLLAMLLTASAGIPSAPVAMTGHCAEHPAGQAEHTPQHQHQHHSDSHCPSHSCASTAPCVTGSSLLGAQATGVVPARDESVRLVAVGLEFASRATPPTPPPPRVRSA